MKDNPFGPERSDESYSKDCVVSLNSTKDSNGIKGANLLSKLKYFKNPMASTNIDYMDQ